MAKTQEVKLKPSGRKASKEVRRAQLIEATFDSIAKRGYSATTMADVADGAGLSRGIVNFHFDSKENLLAEALGQMAAFYRENWEAALRKAGDDPAHGLWAVISSDFDRKVCNRRNIAAWNGLRAEARSRPAYMRICGRHDAAFRNVLTDLVSAVTEAGGYNYDPEKLALGIEAMLEGMWQQILLGPEVLSRQKALACAIEFLVTLFPRHFNREGPLAPKD
ncbi:MAG: TetR family transcriptional regulator C-terminal domain-containing protein [Hyphomicrobiales bacterium]